VRPATWALKIDKTGLKNFHALSTNFYRGAQPSAEGMQALQTMGIKTIVNLRGFHSDKRKTGKLELDREHLYFNTWHAEDEDVISFLKIVTDTNRWPVFVHCQHGSDRTGMMCAMYRMTVNDWTREEAIREMTEGGYGFHPEWQNLLRYLRKVDVEKIRKAAGIASPVAQVPPKK
jgi:protein tyrosine/serine phosphatase